MPDLHLEWTDDAGDLHAFPVTGDAILIGRRFECDLVLPFDFISGNHARVERNARGNVRIEDLGSTNGTFVNDKKVKSAAIEVGDRIGFGQLTLHLRSSDEVAAGSGDALEEFATQFHSSSGDSPGGLDKLSVLLEFQLKWGQSFSAPDLFRAILRHALELSHAQRGFVLVRNDEGFEFAAGLDETGSSLHADSFTTSRSVVRKVSEEREPVFMMTGITGDFAEEESIRAMDLRAVACLPLLESAGENEPSLVAGILYLDSTLGMHRLSGLDEQILQGLAVEAARVLERLGMLRDREERENIERELQLARQTQEELLPRKLPDSAEWTVRAWCRPTRQVGGDLFDFIQRDSGNLVGLLADVSGKGVAASLLSSSVQGAMQAWVRAGLGLQKCVEGLNAYLCERSRDDRFVTLFTFDLSREGHGVYVNAGHLPALVFRAADGRVEQLDERGLVVGALEDMSYIEHELTLASGDLLLVYSDGVTEAADGKGEEFGEEQLERVFTAAASQGIAATADALDAALATHLDGGEPGDDVTVVLLGRVAP